jgi:hypothetical protein
VPAVTLLLTELEYRRCDTAAGHKFDGHRRSPALPDSGALEVVVRGQLLNNLDQEVLLTFRDHPLSGRKHWRGAANEAMFYLDGALTELGNAILPAGRQATFVWVDRRPRSQWAVVHGVYMIDGWTDRLKGLRGRLRGRTSYEVLDDLTRHVSLFWVWMTSVRRSGFELVCEPRTRPRVATVWTAQVVQPALWAWRFGQHDDDPTDDRIGKITGPLDDRSLYYRARFDSTLSRRPTQGAPPHGPASLTTDRVNHWVRQTARS